MTTLFNQDRPIQTIVGSGLYIIPEGYFGKVSLVQDDDALYVNGVKIFAAGNRQVPVTFANTAHTVGDTAGADFTDLIFTATAGNDGHLTGTYNVEFYVTQLSNCDASHGHMTIKHNTDTIYYAELGSNCHINEAINISLDISVGDTVTVYTHLYGNSSYNIYGKSYTTDNGSLISRKKQDAGKTTTTYLKAGDTIEGGKYILSLYEV